MRVTPIALAILFFCTTHASGQVAASHSRAGTQAAQAASDDEGPRAWSLAAAVYTYLLPDEGNYAQPTISLDRDWFHVEARYNYEDLETGSVWVGYNFGGGEHVAWELRPMLGGVFGQTNGIAPGYAASLSWGMLDVYSEGEYVFDAGGSEDSFFYNWSEVAIVPADWFRAGLVTQRTRVYQTERDIQRGLLVGVSFWHFETTAYVFNPDDSKPTVVVSVGLGF